MIDTDAEVVEEYNFPHPVSDPMSPNQCDIVFDEPGDVIETVSVPTPILNISGLKRP